MPMIVVAVLLLGALVIGSPAEDKSYVVDGALKVATRHLQQTHLSTARQPFNQVIAGLHILFDLVLSNTTLQVDGLVRRGDIIFSEDNDEVARFGFNALLQVRLTSSYVLYGGQSAVYWGDSDIHWDLGFNATLITEGCNLKLNDKPDFSNDAFHVDLYSKNVQMNVSYEDDPANAITSVYLQTVSVMIDESLLEIPICEAITC